MSEIQGKVVIITGASSGIGEAAARLLAKHGAHVVMGARRTERLEKIASDIRSEGGSAACRALDVADREQMEAIVRFALETYGKLDVFVNNAGIMPLSKLEALRVEEWDAMIDVNVRGVLYGIAAGLPVMRSKDSAILSMSLRSAPITLRRRQPSIAPPNMPLKPLRKGCARNPSPGYGRRSFRPA